jgi:hypothetical protein
VVTYVGMRVNLYALMSVLDGLSEHTH